MFPPFGEQFVVIASNLGEACYPEWWLNLRADPAASVQVEHAMHPGVAREALGESRETVWRTFASLDKKNDPAYNIQYQII